MQNGKVCLGFDIGGTKCAAVLGRAGDTRPEILSKTVLNTVDFPGPEMMLHRLIAEGRHLVNDRGQPLAAIGISCGGPLDSAAGLILSPPNLPGWDRVPATEILGAAFGVPAKLQNDANACALAEWRWGSGQGYDNLVFCTFGTGLGAGLILDGRLYEGGNGMAGELGHWRAADSGPVGYGKAGSLEGFASGGGIRRLAEQMLRESDGKAPHPLLSLPQWSAREVFALCRQGDTLCQEVVRRAGEAFGQGLARVIDLLNPDAIVVGGIYTRNEDLLHPIVRGQIDRECLPQTARHCRLLPAALGEEIGDLAALGIALALQ